MNSFHPFRTQATATSESAAVADTLIEGCNDPSAARFTDEFVTEFIAAELDPDAGYNPHMKGFCSAIVQLFTDRQCELLPAVLPEFVHDALLTRTGQLPPVTVNWLLEDPARLTVDRQLMCQTMMVWWDSETVDMVALQCGPAATCTAATFASSQLPVEVVAAALSACSEQDLGPDEVWPLSRSAAGLLALKYPTLIDIVTSQRPTCVSYGWVMVIAALARGPWRFTEFPPAVSTDPATVSLAVEHFHEVDPVLEYVDGKWLACGSRSDTAAVVFALLSESRMLPADWCVMLPKLVSTLTATIPSLLPLLSAANVEPALEQLWELGYHGEVMELAQLDTLTQVVPRGDDEHDGDWASTGTEMARLVDMVAVTEQKFCDVVSHFIDAVVLWNALFVVAPAMQNVDTVVEQLCAIASHPVFRTEPLTVQLLVDQVSSQQQ